MNVVNIGIIVAETTWDQTAKKVDKRNDRGKPIILVISMYIFWPRVDGNKHEVKSIKIAVSCSSNFLYLYVYNGHIPLGL